MPTHCTNCGLALVIGDTVCPDCGNVWRMQHRKRPPEAEVAAMFPPCVKDDEAAVVALAEVLQMRHRTVCTYRTRSIDILAAIRANNIPGICDDGYWKGACDAMQAERDAARAELAHAVRLLDKARFEVARRGYDPTDDLIQIDAFLAKHKAQV